MDWKVFVKDIHYLWIEIYFALWYQMLNCSLIPVRVLMYTMSEWDAMHRRRHWCCTSECSGNTRIGSIERWKFKVCLEISFWSLFSWKITLNKCPKACIPLKWIFSEICDLWYWHELLMGQMLVASDQKVNHFLRILGLHWWILL